MRNKNNTNNIRQWHRYDDGGDVDDDDGEKTENICREELCLSAWKYVICQAMVRIACRISVMWHFHWARALLYGIHYISTHSLTHSHSTKNTFVSNDFRMLRILFVALQILQQFFFQQHIVSYIVRHSLRRFRHICKRDYNIFTLLRRIVMIFLVLLVFMSHSHSDYCYVMWRVNSSRTVWRS